MRFARNCCALFRSCSKQRNSFWSHRIDRNRRGHATRGL